MAGLLCNNADLADELRLMLIRYAADGLLKTSRMLYGSDAYVVSWNGDYKYLREGASLPWRVTSSYEQIIIFSPNAYNQTHIFHIASA